ncbi:MAG: hypothetical protein ACR2O2_08100 [Ruegeria sp.]
MLNILSKIFGPHRAVSIYVFLKTKGLAIASVLVMLVIVSSLLLFSGDGEHEHHSYMTLPVLSATPINGNLKNGVIASVRLPDGTATSITSTEAEVSQTVGTSACVEKRIYENSGEFRYRFKLPHYCQAG